MAYVVACYGIVIVTLAGYALHLFSELRRSIGPKGAQNEIVVDRPAPGEI